MCGNNPFRVQWFWFMGYPGFSLRSNPGLKLANAFGVYDLWLFRVVGQKGHSDAIRRWCLCRNARSFDKACVDRSQEFRLRACDCHP